MKNLKMHKTAALIALAVVAAFFLGVFNIGLEEPLLNLIPFRWVLLGLTGYAGYVFYNLLNY